MGGLFIDWHWAGGMADRYWISRLVLDVELVLD